MFKKIYRAILFLLTFLFIITLSPTQAQANEIQVFINDHELLSDQAPFVKSGRTLVPLRAIFEKLEADIQWQQHTQTISAKRGNTTMTLTIGNNTAQVNGKKATLDVPAQIVNNRTMVPLRFVSDVFGAHVNWDQAANKVLITDQTIQSAKPSYLLTATESNRIDDITAIWSTLKPRYTGKILDSQPVVTAPYQLGKINPQAAQEALNMTNFIRFLAYLPADVTIHSGYNADAQAAALVNAINQDITHYPTKPDKMDRTMYNLGSKGASSSNLGMGYETLISSIQDGYMPDYQDSNRSTVGHRRWILSPRLEEVGFGFAVASDGVAHTAMKVISPNMWRNKESPYSEINWPSEHAFPAQFFGQLDPWSVSLNPALYDHTKLDNISVTLTRLNDQKQWVFKNRSLKDGYFNIDTGNYGYTPFTIIFQPKQHHVYQPGEKYRVVINGLQTKAGKQTHYSYETLFYHLD